LPPRLALRPRCAINAALVLPPLHAPTCPDNAHCLLQVRKLVELHRGHLVEVSKLLNHYLTEGVLTETYVVDNL